MSQNLKNLGIYDYDQRIKRTIALIEKELSQENINLIKKYHNAMITESLSKAVQNKHLQTLLNLSRFLQKDWKDVTRSDVDVVLSRIIKKYSSDGQETNTTHDHKKILKIFFRWYKLGSRSKDEVGDPEETKWIRMRRVKDKIVREDLLTEADRTRLLHACGENSRDRALIDCIYDSGTRPGEILSLQLKHVIFDEYGIVLHVDGKTGARPVRLVESIPSLSAWINVHPYKDDPNAPLWISLSPAKYGKPLNYHSARQMTIRRCKMAHISKRVYLNLFRHSEATRTAKFMTEAHMKKRHGWTADSKMPSRYVHLVNNDVDDVIFKHYGIQREEKAQDPSNRLKICPVCNNQNSSDFKLCSRCGKPLSLDAIMDIEKRQETENPKLLKRIEDLESKAKLFDEFEPHMRQMALEFFEELFDKIEVQVTPMRRK